MNFEFSVNSEIDGEMNNSFFHAPFLSRYADLNNDGFDEIIDFGGHYHINGHLKHKNYVYEWFYSKDIQKDIHYDSQVDFKLLRYYQFNSGEIIDKYENISKPDDFDTYFNATFAGTSGDLDNDGDIDIITGSQLSKGGKVINVLINDGEGNFNTISLNVSNINNGYYFSEGDMLLHDLDEDGKKDLIFGGGFSNNNNESIFGFVRGNDSTFDHENFIVIEKFRNGLGLRNIMVKDLNDDGTDEIIAFFSTGNGSGPYYDDEIPNIIKIYKKTNSSDGYLNDVSDQFFSESQNYELFFKLLFFKSF